jgi:putative transposase
MTNHVHLICDPGEDVRRLALLMKHVAGGQTQYVNKMENRSGTLWEGRFRSAPVDSEAYLLTCCRYVELNPVQARLVSHPRDYPWSSYRQKAGLERVRWLDLDPYYLSLGHSWERRAAIYEFSVGFGISPRDAEVIRTAVRRGLPTGNDKFADEIARRIGRRLSLK